MQTGSIVDRLMNQAELDDLWMAIQEIHTFVAGINGISTERIIDRATPQPIYREHLARYKWASQDTAGKDVLDIACGTGYGSHFLVRHSKPASIVAADIDPDAIRYAKLRYKNAGIEFVEADACEAWTERKFDTVISFETIEHVPRPDIFLTQVSRMLNPEGVLHVSSPIRKSGSLADAPVNPYHVREWTVDEFRSLLSLFFEDVEVFGQMFFLVKKLGPIRIPGRIIRMLAKPTPLSSPFFEALNYDVLPFDIVPAKYQAGPPASVIARCRRPKQNVDLKVALAKAMG